MYIFRNNTIFGEKETDRKAKGIFGVQISDTRSYTKSGTKTKGECPTPGSYTSCAHSALTCLCKERFKVATTQTNIMKNTKKTCVPDDVMWKRSIGEQPGSSSFLGPLPRWGKFVENKQWTAELEMLFPNSTYYTGLYLRKPCGFRRSKTPRHQEVDFASPVAVLISLSRSSWFARTSPAESGQWFECDFKRFKEGTEERNFILEQNRTILIFSAYTDCMYFNMQNSRNLKEALISNSDRSKHLVMCSENLKSAHTSIK